MLEWRIVGVKFAVAEMTFSPPLAAPVTYDAWMQITHSLDDCIPVRGVDWLYSLVAVAGDRSICVYQVPYAEAVREAYREARMPFRRIWHGNGTPALPQANAEGLVVVAESDEEQPPAIPHPSAPDLAASVVLTNGNHLLSLFSAIPAATTPYRQIWYATLIHPST